MAELIGEEAQERFHMSAFGPARLPTSRRGEFTALSAASRAA
jgi:hypothetical protein